MGFEKFTGKGRSFRPKVSIWIRGQIGLNQGAVERFNLNDSRYVIMHYDKENKRIGLLFTGNEQEEGALKMNVKNNGAIFSARAFLEYYDIDHTKTRQYDIVYDESNKYYIFDLTKPL